MNRTLGWWLLWGVLLAGDPARAAGPAQEVGLCEQIGSLRVNRGTPLATAQHLLPPLWSVYRVVHFRMCAPDGRPLPGRVDLELEIEPLTAEVTPDAVASRSVWTDQQGRFSGVYGHASRRPGPAWPEGVVSRELHRFRFEGRIIATFVLEREAGDVRFYRWEAGSQQEIASKRPLGGDR